MTQLKEISDYRWLENGQSVLSGKLLSLFSRLDRMFLDWAAESAAVEYSFPPFISAGELQKIDYLHSFPHLATFPVTLDDNADNLSQFASSDSVDGDGEVTLGKLSPVRDVLTPAACYHFYIHLQGARLDAPRYLTTRATCFRREIEYLPLERQWAFSMREVVCVGSSDEVKEFLARYRDRASRFFEFVQFPIEWKPATDPFFNPSRNPKYLLQKLDPVKTEMIFDEHLAIGSVNFHRNYFGEAFGIKRGGEDAFSGCIAFGLERWIHALLSHFGPDEANWPTLES